MAREQLANIDRGAITLAADITNSATSFSLAGSYASLPTAGFRLRIDNEIVTVGSRSGAALSSVTRGVEGSSAASHTAASAVVSAPITAAGFVAGQLGNSNVMAALGSSQALTTSFADVLSLDLPEAGTYLVTGNMRPANTGVTGGAFISVQLTDNANTVLNEADGSTSTLAIPLVTSCPAGATSVDGQVTSALAWLITVASAQTIKLRAKYTLSSGAITFSYINSDSNGLTTLKAARIA